MASVICISHLTGSGGDEVGRRLADRLGFLYVNEEIVAHAATAGGLEPREVADEEKRKSLAARIIDLLAAGGGDMVAGAGAPAYVSDRPGAAEVRALIRETIEQTAARGRVVISAHAAAHALAGRSDVLSVLVTASPANRAGRLREEHQLDDAEADRQIRREDAGRRDYLKRFYDVDAELPTHYDLVINTDSLTVDDAVAIVAHAAGASRSD
ncbi:MAG TPA: cytidylate kinase-like family protein [Gaiellaceae bacterium]